VSLAARCVLLTAVVCCAPASEAQTLSPGPPGPFVVDLRGSTMRIPSDPAFFPVLPEASDVPARGFGADVGVHVYPFAWGPSRVGLGAGILYARGSVAGAGASTVVKGVAPQVSLNFGSRDGWSYLSAGYGIMTLRSAAPVVTTTINASDDQPVTTEITGGSVESGSVPALNVGGGARWFLSPHLAAGFDVRFYRLSAGDTTPSTMLFGAAVGLSLR
jgi:hypothetical protein